MTAEAEYAAVPITVTVNGVKHDAVVEPRTLLVYFLREHLGLTGNSCRLRHQPVRRLHGASQWTRP